MTRLCNDKLTRWRRPAVLAVTRAAWQPNEARFKQESRNPQPPEVSPDQALRPGPGGVAPGQLWRQCLPWRLGDAWRLMAAWISDLLPGGDLTGKKVNSRAQVGILNRSGSLSAVLLKI